MRSTVLCCLGLALTVPAAGQNLTFAHDQHMVIVPFYTFNRHIYVKARVNDSGEMDFLVDPGLREVVVVIDPVVAQTTNFPMTDTASLWLKTLRIGRQHVTWTSPRELEATDGHSFSGVLGYGFLKNFVWRFDGKHGRLIITDPAFFADNTLHGKVPVGGDLMLMLRQGKTVTLNFPHNYMIVSE